ncbi:hypothetical protein CYMTET_30591 [Cymbomonas tetramitiformis]|uniref:SHSP domain-containing protein n=1 Tax=Cymbomonas tetramitiformis TaxID=36881 RepID=A0AAE0KTZ5_9CHLO|nr:hypothetical protein CYMTET_30591 [Cymbomonas tetramitiformis]
MGSTLCTTPMMLHHDHDAVHAAVSLQPQLALSAKCWVDEALTCIMRASQKSDERVLTDDVMMVKRAKAFFPSRKKMPLKSQHLLCISINATMQTDKNYKIVVELPGLTTSDVKIETEDAKDGVILTIDANKTTAEEKVK